MGPSLIELSQKEEDEEDECFCCFSSTNTFSFFLDATRSAFSGDIKW
jgi:hypothetical protein